MPGEIIWTYLWDGVRPSSALPSTALAVLLRSLPIGNRVVNAVDVTPGMAAILFSTACCIRVTRAGSATMVAAIFQFGISRSLLTDLARRFKIRHTLRVS